MQTSVALLVAIISAASALAVAAVGYSLNKRRDREAEWRKLKLDHYREYVSALSGVVGERSSVATQTRYSDAVNAMTLVAPSAVLRALYEFQDEVAITNRNKSSRGHDETLTTLLRAIRLDVHPQAPGDDGLTFRLFNAPAAGDDGPRGLGGHGRGD